MFAYGTLVHVNAIIRFEACQLQSQNIEVYNISLSFYTENSSVATFPAP